MLYPFFAALANLRRRLVFPSPPNSAQWQQVAPAIRQTSFFSATIDKARVLMGYKKMLLDWSESAVEEVDGPFGKKTAYKVGSQADFVRQGRELLVREGLAQPDDFGGKEISNIASNERLKLIFNTNILQSAELATWQSRVEDQAYINQFPAARFMRTPGADTPRPRHVAAENKVRRWDDFEFWLYQNSSEIGGFDVPWGPWGFNSYMYQQPVKRKEAERLGLVKPGEIVKPINGSRWGATPSERLKESAKADVRKVSPQISDQLKAELRAAYGNDLVDDNGKLSLKALQAVRTQIEAKRKQIRPTEKQRLQGFVPQSKG